MRTFKYQAVDAGGQARTDTIEADSMEEAAQALRDKGLFVTQLTPMGAGAARQGCSRLFGWIHGVRFRDVVLFTQQMSMLLRSGARVTEALDAIADQNLRPAWAAVVAALRNDVEEGRPLSAALNRFPRYFPGLYVSMVLAGEASGEIGQSFSRLADLTRQQQEIRRRVIGAVSYPAVLMVLCAAVIVIMLVFVLPRFAEMFEALDVELPWTTAMMIAVSGTIRDHWLLSAGVAAGLIAAGIYAVRGRAGRQLATWLIVRLPVFGELVRNIIIARLCRIWGQLLESKVDLLHAVELVSTGAAHPEFRQLMERIRTAVTQGSRIGPELRACWLIPKTYAGAISTGEESGRLADALLFVSDSLEDQNRQTLEALSRIIEPLILAVMGLVVGTLAFSLFLPMFDMATVQGG